MNSLFVTIVVTLILLATFTTGASADPIRLEYKGKTYTSVHNDPFMDGEYEKSMRVTGWIELEDPLDPNCVCFFSSDSDGLLGFSFFDGVQIHRGGDGAESFTFGTDSRGNIVSWAVYTADSLMSGAPVGGADSELFISSIFGDSTFTFCDNCDESDPWGANVWHAAETTRTGRWKVVAVPEPATLSLLLVGLAGLGFGSRRRHSFDKPHCSKNSKIG